MCSLLYLSEVTDPKIKWPIAFCAFFVGFVFSSAYYLYFKATSVLMKAVVDLTRAFDKDVTNLLQSPADLNKLLDQKQKVLVLVEAVSLVKNLLVKTYRVGYCCQNKRKLAQRNLYRIYESLTSLIQAMGLNLEQVIAESKNVLQQSEQFSVFQKGKIGALDQGGRE